MEAGAAQKCEIQLDYALGVKEPVSLQVNIFGTGTVSDTELEKITREVFDFKPKSIIRDLNLRKPIFLPTAKYGHFGRTADKKLLASGESMDLFAWEGSNKVDEIRTALKM